MSGSLVCDNLSYSNELTNLNGHNEQREALLKKIECQEINLKSDEVISIMFLLHRNALETYKDLEDFLNGRKSNLIYKWCKQGVEVGDMWEKKFYESLFIIKNYRMLKAFDIEAVNAVHTFNHRYLIPNIRLELYKICEHIYGPDLNILLVQMRETSVKECLEMYLLKWISEGLISVDNEVDIKVLADSLQAMKMTKFADNILHYQSSIVSLGEQLAKTEFVEDYPIIDPNNVGLCLIINQKRFIQDPNNQKIVLGERNGTQFDGERLDELFRMHFKFDVKTEQNIPSVAMINIIQEKIKMFFKPNHSVFVLIILSHGTKDFVYGSDSKPVSIIRIESCLKIPQLEVKPKIIIIQACQGDDYVRAPTRATLDAAKIEGDDVTARDWPTDTIFCMSTIPLFASPRHKEKGAWYIIKLCEVLKKHSEEELHSVLIKLSRILNTEPVFGSQHQIRTIPEFRSRLTKNLYLRKVQKSN
ncbi:hypothetical protein O3M35_001164 [Rhynocoris fuscipes]|uniref:Caspase-8 n=1 Tax=Rhynocoris fuscipes TaxID=488301 RepID=A0AAW1DQS7_9HEMI